MAVPKKAMTREDLLQWFKATNEKAQQLLLRTERVSRTVFSSSEKLTGFLELAARIHHFDAYNLLLIWEQCPSASCLAGYKVWERQLPNAQVLKREHRGRGIELLAPFTNALTANHCLVWYSVTVYDISQTMLPVSPPAFDPAYVLDAGHEDYLLDAIKMAIGSSFHRSVIIEPASEIQQETGLPGQISQSMVSARADLSQSELLQWLTEALILLAAQNANLDGSSLQLLKTCVSFCLFRIWGLEKYALPPHTVQLKAADRQELAFLHIFRDTLRQLNNLVSSCYAFCRKESDYLTDGEIDALLDPGSGIAP